MGGGRTPEAARAEHPSGPTTGAACALLPHPFGRAAPRAGYAAGFSAQPFTSTVTWTRSGKPASSAR